MEYQQTQYITEIEISDIADFFDNDEEADFDETDNMDYFTWYED